MGARARGGRWGIVGAVGGLLGLFVGLVNWFDSLSPVDLISQFVKTTFVWFIRPFMHTYVISFCRRSKHVNRKEEKVGVVGKLKIKPGKQRNTESGPMFIQMNK